MSVLWGSLWDWYGLTLRDCYFLRDWIFFLLGFTELSFIFALFLLLFLATMGWISLDLRPSTYRQVVTDLYVKGIVSWRFDWTVQAYQTVSELKLIFFFNF
jgi:hypothetical protein